MAEVLAALAVTADLAMDVVDLAIAMKIDALAPADPENPEDTAGAVDILEKAKKKGGALKDNTEMIEIRVAMAAITEIAEALKEHRHREHGENHPGMIQRTERNSKDGRSSIRQGTINLKQSER